MAPVRDFRWAKGVESFAGWYYCATSRDRVGYESWLERDHLILMDRDPQVVGLASRPFWLHWHDGTRRRRHAPDYFVRLADGRGRVVDVRADDQVDDAAAESFEAMEPACRAVGWEFVRAGTPAGLHHRHHRLGRRGLHQGPHRARPGRRAANISLTTRHGAEVADALKYFSERIAATFIYAGIEIEHSSLLSGTRGAQIARLSP
ncbi:MAG TPA: TnsA-like heteromeric transposase endonuclease subunit [Streptomyces sp.]|uniref:TnsA-like heteromeric transposase endonuclease subunit n=1 Tax=Streptomyces sp. TaxID=1931 RepID=UPI002D589CEB|nr:TnsA-like heteromeric transposase endonuclease subunit [Streptomyces sp.]HZG03185.1 TnsA-like heteromeric transposase endonuclease subunit [Streptomyces sp.]